MKAKFLFIPFLLMFFIVSLTEFYKYIFIKPNLPQSLSTYNLYSYGTIAAFIIFFVIMYIMLLAVKDTPEKYIMKRNIFAGIFALLAGVSINLYSMYEYIYNTELTNINLIFNCANCIIGFILIIMSIATFSKKNIFKDLPLLALAPAALFCFKLAYTTFFTYPNLIEISNQTFKMLSILSWTLFSFVYAKLLSNFQAKTTLKKVILFGITCFCLIFVYAAPDLILNFNNLDISEILRLSSYMALGLFALSIAIELMTNNKIDLVHSYSAEDYTTFEEDSINKLKDEIPKDLKPETKIKEENTKPRSNPMYFENLIDNKVKNEKKQAKEQTKSNDQELDADALVDDILKNNQ